MQDGDWTTVDFKRRRQDSRQQETQNASIKPAAHTRLDPLQQIDAAWQEETAAKSHEHKSQQPNSKGFSTEAQGRFVNSQEEVSRSKKQSMKAKPKQQKSKRHKPQPPEQPCLEARSTQLFLQQLEQKYAGNDTVQLQALIDHLLIKFKDAPQNSMQEVNFGHAFHCI